MREVSGSRRERWRGALVLALLCVLAGAARAQQAPERWSGQVTRVSDGDTLWVRPQQPQQPPLKLRLAGLDAPERCQPGGAQARDALAARLLGRAVQVEVLGRDDYGRLLVRLRHGEGAGEGRGEGGPADVGAWLVAAGHAWSDRLRGDPYAAEERAARAAGRGLFADAAARPPWRFRREHGPCEW